MARTKKLSAPAPAAAAAPATPSKRLLPPKGGAVVRMYRIGHGDCFLLAFAGDKEDEPSYVLVDCGYKPGSPKYAGTRPAEIAANIHEATGGHVHVAVITHEHQDHVNGITKTHFEKLKIDQTWMAWTEDPEDGVANDLRKIYKDKLLGLIAARNRLAADAGEAKEVTKVDHFLSFELGGEEETFDPQQAIQALAADEGGGGGGSMNKKSMQIFKDLAGGRVTYLRPHDKIRRLPGAQHVRVYSFGPPRDLKTLQQLDPEGKEEFHGKSMAMASAGNYFAMAASSVAQPTKVRTDIPFALRYRLHWDDAVSTSGGFYFQHYGKEGAADVFEAAVTDSTETDLPQAVCNPKWRRIDNEWLYSAGQLALAMNNDTNNASLVLAFELGQGGKVLLFVGDAQAGNWRSWDDGDWEENGRKITTKELMGRTVLYKVGHHCSHNATLNGEARDDYPNLGWMAAGDYADEFTAMITAVREWAQQSHVMWDHPLKAIKDELLAKGSGRVLQTDTDFDKLEKPALVAQSAWDAFLARTTGERLYFDYQIPA